MRFVQSALLVFMVICTLAGASQAADKNGRYAEIFGLSHNQRPMRECSTFIRIFQEARGRDTNNLFMYRAWMMGYMTGVNEYQAATFNVGNFNLAASEQWIANFCRNNPFASFHDALQALLAERHNGRVIEEPAAR